MNFQTIDVKIIIGGDVVKLLQTTSLVRRLPMSHAHFPYWQDQLSLTIAGHYGETMVQKFLLEVSVSYTLLPNFYTVSSANTSHEMDCIFICPHFVLVLEVKNITGTIDMDMDTGQLIRTKTDGTVERFVTPVLQVNRHVRFLNAVLPNIPVVKGIVFSNKQAYLRNIPKDEPIFHLQRLVPFIEELVERFKDNRLDVAKIYQYLDSLRIPNLLEIRFTSTDFIRGVFCPSCTGRVIMHFQHGKFICPRCKSQDKDAHFIALAEYRLLCGETITNQAFREWCGVKDRYASNRLLKALPKIGYNKGTVYEILEQILSMYRDFVYKTHIKR